MTSKHNEAYRHMKFVKSFDVKVHCTMTHNCLVIPSSLSDVFRLPYNPQYMYVRTYDVHIKYILHDVRIHMLFVYFTRNEVRCTISLSFLFFDISHIAARILINSIFRVSCIIFQPTTSNYTLLYQSISCCILDYYFILSFIIHNIMNYDAVLYHIMSIYSMLCHVILYHIVLHYIHIILHHIILYCIVS